MKPERERDDAMETMTPSAESTAITTSGQISKAVGNYRALLEKHAREFNSEAVQKGLGHPNLAIEMFAFLRKYVEMFQNMIVRRVTDIDRGLNPQQVLDATGRRPYADKDVVATMPRGTGEEKEIVFFKLDRKVSDDDLEKEYLFRGLKPADPYTLAKYNMDDPWFADTHFNCTHWKDGGGKWCYLAFEQWRRGGRLVYVNRHGSDWDDYCWFAGVSEQEL